MGALFALAFAIKREGMDAEKAQCTTVHEHFEEAPFQADLKQKPEWIEMP
jgi:hypothetical protein